MINLFIDIYLPNSVTYLRRTSYQPIDDMYLRVPNVAMKSSSCTGTRLNWRRNSKKQDDSVKVLRYVTFVELLSCCYCCCLRSAFWSAESEAPRSAEHYGPLKTRLYQGAKHYGPLKARLKAMEKSQIFLPFFYI